VFTSLRRSIALRPSDIALRRRYAALANTAALSHLCNKPSLVERARGQTLLNGAIDAYAADHVLWLNLYAVPFYFLASFFLLAR